MKKIGIVTIFHNNFNFGASLQAYSLQHILNQMGHDAEVIDILFPTPEVASGFRFKMTLKRLVSETSKILSFYRLIRRYLMCIKSPTSFKYIKKEKELAMRAEKFNRFKKEYINTSRPIFQNELKDYTSKFDVLIVGSDQVWNPAFLEKPYLLGFAKENQVKASYAASISRPVLTAKEISLFKHSLEDYDYISVREEDGKRLLESFLDKPIYVDLDPTMLLTQHEWEKIADNISIPKNYILCCLLGHSGFYVRFARKVADMLNRKLVCLTTSQEGYKENWNIADIELIDVSPRQFITLVKEADIVLTDSFHVSVFSILFHKNFYILKRDSDSDTASMNSRYYTLLEGLGIEDRIIDGTDLHAVKMDNKIPDKAYERLSAKRLESLGRLKKIVQIDKR